MPEHLWMYGVVDGEAPVPAQLGVDPNYRVQRVRAAGLAALVSHVGYDEHTLRAALQDQAAFETLAASHERVLDAALANGPVLPLQVGAVFATEAGVRELLAQAYSAFATTLRRLRGRAEWGLKVYAPRQVAVPRIATPVLSGTDHRAGWDAADRSADDIEPFLLVIHARLTDHACDVLVKSAPPGSLAPAGLVLDARYLVADEHAGAFGAVASQLAGTAREYGMQLDLTGPWPAYHFSALGV